MYEGEGENWDIYPNEPPWAIDNITKNECAVAYFGGQTALYIPKGWFVKLGPNAEQKIIDSATKIFGAEGILSTTKCKKSFLIELPPQTGWGKKQYQPFADIAKLIELIRKAAK